MFETTNMNISTPICRNANERISRHHFPYLRHGAAFPYLHGYIIPKGAETRHRLRHVGGVMGYNRKEGILKIDSWIAR
jgi:hypothetical protein